MKSILKILVLGAVLILGTTAVVDQGLAADKGSQLIFQSNTAHTNYISVANAHSSQAVTVLVQYYNDEMEMILWYLRVLPADSNVLVNPFDHTIPGSDPATNAGEFITGTGKENSGHFVIAVTAVGANLDGLPAGTDVTVAATGEAAAHTNTNDEPRVNVLFPDFLAEDLHGTDNIDNGGVLTSGAQAAVPDPAPADPVINNRYARTKPATEADDGTDDDNSSKNVGKMTVENAIPVSFNHLTGHFTEALVTTAAGGADQTLSWGGTPIIRPSVDNTANAMAFGIQDYQALNGTDVGAAGEAGGRLAEKDAGGAETSIENAVSGYTNEGANMAGTDDPTPTNGGGKIDNTADGSPRTQRGLNDMGALVLPALHGGGAESQQIMLMLSVADEFGAPGEYKLMAAKTGYMVTLMDSMGDALPNPAAQEGPVFGGADNPEPPPGTKIIVDGIRVWTDAGDCNEDADGNLNEEGMIMGPWTLDHLTSIVPSAVDGTGDFAGLGADMVLTMNASPGWIKFMRTGLECKHDYGDDDIATGTLFEDADGVPATDVRTFNAGTLVMDEKATDRAFVTTGRALLKFITPGSTFAASWTLKSPSSPAN